jgi:hypothetical protein
MVRFIKKIKILTEEFQWINNKLGEIDNGSKFRAATRVSDALIEIRSTYAIDPWKIIARHFMP